MRIELLRTNMYVQHMLQISSLDFADGKISNFNFFFILIFLGQLKTFATLG